MVDSPGVGAQGLRVFLSYRRDDSGGQAGRLYDALSARLGHDSVFMDIDAIPLGVDFTAEIARWVEACDVLIAVVGRDWLTATDESGSRRLDSPDDFVRIEIESALHRDIPVIPVFVRRGRMPRASDLPPSMSSLTTRNGIELRDEAWASDVERLVRHLDEIASGRRSSPGRAAPGRDEPGQGVPAVEDRAAVDALPSTSFGQAMLSFRYGRRSLSKRRPRRIVGFSPDRTRISTLSGRHGRVWGTESGQELVRVTHDDADLTVAVFSPDGACLATASGGRGGGGSARVWDASTGRELARLEQQPVMDLAFSRDGTRLTTVGSQATNIWDIATGQLVTYFTHLDMWGIATDTDGGLVLGLEDSAQPGGDRVALYEIATRRRLTGVAGRQPTEAALSADGSHFALVAGDAAILSESEYAVSVWESATGREVARLPHPRSEVFGLAFSADGKRIATACSDTTARLWDAASGSELARFRHDEPVWSVGFSLDGTRLVTATADHHAHVWELPPTRREGSPVP